MKRHHSTRRGLSMLLCLALTLSLLVPAGATLAADAQAGWESVEHTQLTYSAGWTAAETAHQTDVIAAYCDYTYTGRGIKLVAPKGPDMGRVNIYLDGSFAGTADLYAAAPGAAGVVFTSADLEDGAHTVRVVCTGDQNLTSTGSAVAVSQLWYEEGTGEPTWAAISPFDSEVSYDEAGWNTGNPENYVTSFPGSYYEYEFTGDKIGIYNASWGDRGICDIYIDGALVDVVDFREGPQDRNVRWESGILESGAHTLKVVLNDTYTADPEGPRLNLLGLRYSADSGATWTEVENQDIMVAPTPVSFGWDGTKHTNAMYTNTPGAWAEGTFTGTRVGVLFGAWYGRGAAEIYVDDALIDTVSTDKGDNFWWESAAETPFNDGEHTIKLVYIGNGNELFFSGFKSADGNGDWSVTPDEAFRDSFTWSAKRQWTNSKDHSEQLIFAQTGDENASFTYTFEGTDIAWLADKGPDRGTATVAVDGGAPVTVDQHADVATPVERIFEKTGLDMGTHTMEVTCNGDGKIVSYGFAVPQASVEKLEHHLNFKVYEGGGITGIAGNYRPGDEIAISAQAEANYEFVSWYALNGDGSMFGDATDPDTFFTMPAGDVTVIAVFTLMSENIYAYANLDTAAYDLGENGDRVAGPDSRKIGTDQYPASTRLFPQSNVSMTVNGYPIRIYDQMQGVVNSTSKAPVRLARFQMPEDEPVEIVMTWPEEVDTVTVYPLPYNIKAEIIDDYSFKFTLETPLKVRVDVNGVYNGVCIFPDPMEENPPQLGDPNVTNVVDYISADYLARTAPTNEYGDTPDLNDKNFPNCTKAFQAAIDAVSAQYDADTNPTPVLYVPDGVYRIGTIYIKSHVNLYLSSGAVLLAGTRVQSFTGKVTSDMDPATENNNFDIAYDYQSDQPAVRAWIRAVDAHDFKLYGRGILDANGRYFQNSTETSKNKRLIGLFFNGGEWNPETGKPYVLSNQPGQMPGPADENDFQDPEWLSKYEYMQNTHDFVVEDLLLFDSWFYNSAVDSCYNGTFNNFKVNSNYFEGSGRNEQDGFKINASSDISFDDGWLIAGDDPFTIAACGPTAFGNSSNNVVRNTIFNPEQAGYVRFAFVEHGFTYSNNLLNNIYCIDSPVAYEVFKGESYGGYQYDALMHDNTFSDWYIDGTHKLLQLGMGYQNNFRYKGLMDFNFDRIIIDGLTNSSEVKNEYPDAPTQVKFTDLVAGGEYIDNVADAGIRMTATTPQGPMQVDFAVTGDPWVKVMPGTVDGLAISYTEDSASFTFTGSQVRWYATKGAGNGSAIVYIDNRRVAEVDLEGAGNGSEIVYESADLGATRHTITVVFSNGRVSCDAFEFLKFLPGNTWETVAGTEYSSGWAAQGNAYAADGTGAYCDTAFVGGAFKVLAYTGPDMGIANLYVDGRLVDTVDLYSAVTAGPSTIYKSADELWDMQHTVRLVCTGRKNPLSAGVAVNLSAIQQMPAQWVEVPADDANMDYSSGWTASDGAYVSSTAGSSVTYAFVGGGVRWMGGKGPDGGIAKVYLNDVPVGTVDTGAANSETGVLFEAADLLPGENSITIEVESGQVNFRGIQHLKAAWSSIAPTDPRITYSGPGWSVSNSNEWRASNENVWIEYTAENVTSLAYLASSWGDRGWGEITITDSEGVEIDYSAYNIIRNDWNNMNKAPLNQVDTSRGATGESVSGQAMMWQITGLPLNTYTIRIECMNKGGKEGNTQINFLGVAYGAEEGDSLVMTRVAPGTAAEPGDGLVPSGFANGKFWQKEEGGNYMTAKLNSGEDAWFEYAFKGSSIAWLNRGLTGRSVADIYLDGVKVAEYNQGAGSSTVSKVFERTGLDPAVEHTLRVYAAYATGSGGSGERWFTNYGLAVILYPDGSAPYTLDAYAPTGGSITIGEGGDCCVGGAGDVFQVTALPDQNYRFAGWTSLNGGVFADTAAAETTYTMPAGDATLIALFEYTEPDTPSSGGSSSNIADTTRNPDGSTTKTVTDKKTGEVVETTTYPDGAKIVATTPKDGETTIEFTMPKGKDSATVTIPTAEQPQTGEVAVILREDGTREVVKISVSTEYGMRVTLTENCVLKIVDNSRRFADVAASHWAADSIQFVASRELFTGTGGENFAPAGDMTRSMLVTVLARLDGQDTNGGETWYSKAMDWGVENGVTDGTNMDASITRESLVVMLYRYAKAQAPKDAVLSSFPDAESVSDWAEEAMAWAVQSGILTGNGAGELNPAGTASRAEVAAILMRFVIYSVK